MKKMGFVLNSAGPNQPAFQIITSANALLSQRDDIDVSLFYKQLSPYVVQPAFACYHFAEVFNYDGDVICMDMFSVARVVSYPGPRRNRIYLYSANLDYLHLPSKQYEHLREIYENPHINLIARSQSHAEILSLWQTPKGVVEHFSASGFARLLYPELFGE